MGANFSNNTHFLCPKNILQGPFWSHIRHYTINKLLEGQWRRSHLLLVWLLLVSTLILRYCSACWSIFQWWISVFFFIQETQLKLAVADRTKPEVEIWRRPKKWTFWPWFPIHSFRHFFTRTYRFATIQNVTDDDDRQTDRQTTHCAIVRSAKNAPVTSWLVAFCLSPDERRQWIGSDSRANESLPLTLILSVRPSHAARVTHSR